MAQNGTKMNPIEQLTRLISHKNNQISANSTQAIKYNNALVNGDIDKVEYQDLIEGLSRTQIISDQADDLADIILLNEALEALLTLSGAI